MADNNTLGQYSNWPPYPGYGNWDLTSYEDTSKIPGSGDNRISSDLIPSRQFSVKYTPYSNEIPISAWTPPAGLPTSWLAHTGYTTGATISASYQMWLQSNEQYCAMFQLFSVSDASYFGNVPPTFDYSIGDTFKECVHYGFEGMFFVFIETSGIVHFISMDSFYAYPEYLARCRYKGFRMFSGDITSISYVSGRGTSGNWTYKLSTTLKNDKSGIIDLSSSSVKMSLSKVKADGTFDVLESGTINVISLDGPNATITGPAPSDTSKDYPDGWKGGYFVFDKIVLINNPLLLYTDNRKVSGTLTIPNNSYVTETSKGYESRSQQMEKSGTISGIYVSKSSIVIYLTKKVADNAASAASATTPLTPETVAASANNAQDLADIIADKYPLLVSEGMVYGDLTTDFGKRLLVYTKDLNPTIVTFVIGIGGGATQFHNMHAGCLSGDYVTSTTATYRISNQLRRSIFQLETRSRTSAKNILDELIALTDPSKYNVTVGTSRCWFFNDITFTSDKMSLNEAAFWGNITSVTASTTLSDPVTINVTHKIDGGFYGISDRQKLINRFTQNITPIGTQLVKKWDEQKGWKLNNYGKGSYNILSMKPSTVDSESYDIVVEASLSDISVDNSKKWWISFDSKFELSGNYNYVSQPFFAMDGKFAGTGSTMYGSVILDGIYVGNPFLVPLPGDVVLSVALENGGIYPNTVLPPSVFVSTSKKGSSLNFSKNKFLDKRYLCYQRFDDQSSYLMIRSGAIKYNCDVEEKFAYYGDAKYLSCPVSGSSGNDLVIDIGSAAKENNVIGFMCKRSSSVPEKKSGSYPFVAWGVYHGNYFLGYVSTSELVSTIYSTRDGKYSEETKNMFNFYLPGTIVSSGFIKYRVPINTHTPNSNVGNISVLKLVPENNQSQSPSIGDVKVFFVPYSNTVSGCTSPFVYSYENSKNMLLFLKNQAWLFSSNSENSGNVEVVSCNLIKKGTQVPNSLVLNVASTSNTVPTGNDEIKSRFDLQQDGVFFLSTYDNFDSFNSGMFSRPKNWNAPDSVNPTDPGQKITSISSVTEENLYKIPHLLVQNITRCSYSHNKNNIDIVGFSKVKSSLSSDYDVLSLVFYRINPLDVLNYPVYEIKGWSSSKILFSYCDCPKGDKRLLNQKIFSAIYTKDNPAIKDPEPDLVETSVSVGSDNASIIVVVHLKGGIIFLISVDSGNNWAYFDDIKLVNDSSTPTSSPSVKVVDGNINLFYLLSNSDLYLKVIPFSKLVSLVTPCVGVRSSSVKDSKFLKEKNNVQVYLDTLCKNVFVAQINDQQVSFEMSNQQDLNVVYQDVQGKIRSISTNNLGYSWNYKPVNF